MSDPAIIEAAARALCVHTTGGEKTWGYPLEREWYRGLAEAVLAAVTPLIEADSYVAVIKLKSIIEADTLERAAKVAEEYDGRGIDEDYAALTCEEIAALIRALKKQPAESSTA